jgi:alanyl-tRNA synthetase
MKTQAIREIFLDYFHSKKHKIVNSSSLLPKEDPTLLFTNAGMNQFKNIFLGLEKKSYKRAASVQKCMRVSGKHNDLEQVGRTNKHHTFFEMLGNFSFGDYFKEEAIAFAWEFFIDVLRLDTSRLYVTVYTKDDESFRLWNEKINVSADRIFRFGKKDNYWAMGETGPCGPCSEIHYDLDPGLEEGKPHDLIEKGSDRFLELWNLVFMQFHQKEDGTQTPLPSPSIDTGMGLERMAAVLQGKKSNFETDLFMPLIHSLSDLCGLEYGSDQNKDVSMRIIVDHLRAVSFLIGDGIMPANEGRGYVLRRIIRRAYRHGTYLGLEEPFLFKLLSGVFDIMKDAYPELLGSSEYIAKICLSEEKRFARTLNSGLKTFNQYIRDAKAAGLSGLSGAQLFKLYDTFGFPPELSRELAADSSMAIDEAGFQKELEKQRSKARQAWKGDAAGKEREIYTKLNLKPVQFLGYENNRIPDARIEALLQEGKSVTELKEGDKAEAILDKTPFYAEAGGQVGDSGILKNPHFSALVETCYYPVPDIIAHKIKVMSGSLKAMDRVEAEINTARRNSIRRNHTATHLLHASLQNILGEHVKQAGSLVSPSRFRFDFTHFAALDRSEIHQVESMVNEKIRENLSVQTEVLSLEDGLARGATAIFEEKYGETVRMVSIDEFSRELCGGIHVRATGDIGLFKIISESSIAAGMRRIEAVTGEDALSTIQEGEELLLEIQSLMGSPRQDLFDQIDKLKSSLKESERNNRAFRQKLANQKYKKEENTIRTVKGVSVWIQLVEGLNQAELRELSDSLKQKIKSGIVLLGIKTDKKAFLTAAVTPDLTDRIKAVDLIKKISPLIDGGGGGRPDFAQAGGSAPDKLAQVLNESTSLIEDMLE